MKKLAKTIYLGAAVTFTAFLILSVMFLIVMPTPKISYSTFMYEIGKFLLSVGLLAAIGGVIIAGCNYVFKKIYNRIFTEEEVKSE